MVSRELRASLLVLTLWISFAPAAYAGWPLQAPGSILLGYGEAWVGGDSVHRGVDIACDAAARIVAPEDGTVAFAGRVPSGSADGTTVWAVSLDLPDGDRLTVMPLAETSVEAGRSVEEGCELGVLAPAGDPSHPEAHLHVSLRRNGAYLDPTSRLEVPAPPASESPVPEPQGEHTGAGRSGAPTPGVHPEGRPQPVPGAASAASASTAPKPSADGRMPDAASTPSTAAEPSAEGASQRVSPGASTRRDGAAARTWSADRLGRAAAARRRAASAAAETSLSPTSADWLASLAVSVARWAGGTLLACATGAALLWPLWRREETESPEGVRPVGDDVAAAVGRC